MTDNFCFKCGTALRPNAEFCSSCGISLVEGAVKNTPAPAATISALDTGGDVGLYTSVTIGADGLGLISYFDDTNETLKVLHCENTFCSPNFRRR